MWHAHVHLIPRHAGDVEDPRGGVRWVIAAQGALLEGPEVTRPAIDPVAFAEKVLALLELGRFAATYKYALFTAIMDLCLEQASPAGTHPTTLTTTQLAEKIIELYWQHASPYEGGEFSAGRCPEGSQGKILRPISGIASGTRHMRRRPLFRVRVSPLRGLSRSLSDEVEWKLIEMPIPRLQVIGREEDRFLYEYSWGKGYQALARSRPTRRTRPEQNSTIC